MTPPPLVVQACPFCGAPATYDNRNAGYVGCSNPQSVCKIAPSIRGDYQTDIVAVWNQRATTSAQICQRLGAWLSAALDDPKAGEAFKADIRAWFEAGGDRMGPTTEGTGPASVGHPENCFDLTSIELIRSALRTGLEWGMCSWSGDDTRAIEMRRALASLPPRDCPYCGYTGLPGNACENCMNTGMHPDDAALRVEFPDEAAFAPPARLSDGDRALRQATPSSDGWVCVPREPTHAMKLAGEFVGDYPWTESKAVRIWHAMLAAALHPTKEQP